MFNCKDKVYAIVKNKNQYYLVNNEREILLDGKISQVFYSEDEECLIFLR